MAEEHIKFRIVEWDLFGETTDRSGATKICGLLGSDSVVCIVHTLCPLGRTWTRKHETFVQILSQICISNLSLDFRARGADSKRIDDKILTHCGTWPAKDLDLWPNVTGR